MKLGTLNLENNLILAPLKNVTTAPYRRFCRHFQKVGLVCVPMLYSERLMNCPKSIEHELFKIEEESPISVQLIGSEPNALTKAIEYLESYKFDVLDINAGCPSKRAIHGKKGGYLLKDLKRLEELLQITIKYSSRPVSLKTRLGFEYSANINEIAKIANNSGIDFLIVHARSVMSRFENSGLNLDALKRLKEKIDIPLVGNGDIDNPTFAKYFLDYTGVDALMIGRGAMGNPELFHQIHEYITKGINISKKNNLDLMKEYLKIYEQFLDNFMEGIKLKYSLEQYKFTELKRNSIWLTKNIKNSTYIRRELSKTKNLKHLKIILNNIHKN